MLYFSVHRYDNGCFYPGSPDAKGDRVGVGAGAPRMPNSRVEVHTLTWLLLCRRGVQHQRGIEQRHEG